MLEKCPSILLCYANLILGRPMSGQERLRFDILQNRVLAYGENYWCVQENAGHEYYAFESAASHGENNIVVNAAP